MELKLYIKNKNIDILRLFCTQKPDRFWPYEYYTPCYISQGKSKWSLRVLVEFWRPRAFGSYRVLLSGVLEQVEFLHLQPV